MSFLGPVGSVIPVKCASQLTAAGGRPVSFQDTLGKRKAFLGNVKAREWSVDIGLAKPQELSGLRWLAENVDSPMVWYSPDAVVGNILPPDVAGFTQGAHNGLDGQLVEVEPGVWVKSALNDGTTSLRIPYGGGAEHALPVIAGHPVAVSAWMRGNEMRITVMWYDQSGTLLATDTGANESHASWVRMSRVLVAPPAAARAEVRFVGSTQVAGPAVTLTDRVMPYSPGRGATNVIVHGLSDAVIRATDQQQLGSLSFTISEVG